MAELYECDRCGEMMRGSVDATVRIKGLSDSLHYHACEDCANEIAVIAAGND